MNASRTDQPRTSPVALRTNIACSNGAPVCAVPSIAISVIPFLSRFGLSAAPDGGALSALAAREYEALDLLLAVEIDHRAEQLTLLIGTARVDAQRPSEAPGGAALMDVAVQRQRRLVALDRVAHSRRADRLDRVAGVLQVHLLDPLGQLGLVLLAVGVPGCPVGPPARGHLEAVDVDHAALAELDRIGVG